jgi:hypothetical protein
VAVFLLISAEDESPSFTGGTRLKSRIRENDSKKCQTFVFLSTLFSLKERTIRAVSCNWSRLLNLSGKCIDAP